jgi:GTPase SAR1 family protein
MAEEMNTILGDPSWWNAIKRGEAERVFSKAVVNAFYDEIQAGREDPEKLREQHLPLPSAEDGYSRVLFVGTTGAGKTSLLRQLIGSDPDEDRFPSTAPAKTTIANIEVIQAESEYSAIVTFFSEFQVQVSIEECITDACLVALDGVSDEKVLDRFLNHRDQKFRLSYILGTVDTNEEEEELSFDEEGEPDTSKEERLADDDRVTNIQVLNAFVTRIKDLSEKIAKGLSKTLDEDIARLTGGDRDAFDELFELDLTRQQDFDELVQDVLETVRERFGLIQLGELRAHRSGWPELWLFNTADRADFIQQIRWFSSNYWPHFGRLLTPLVQGIRVKGPLYPTFSEKRPTLVLIDGQGLGHSPDSSSSVSTHITKRFSDVDLILLVDNAEQPMQAAPLSVLRSVAASGYQEKLAIAFTHFDQIKGKNLPTFSDKRAHVMASVTHLLSSLKDILGAPLVKSIERSIEARCFMLGGVDRLLTKLPSKAADYMKNQLLELIALCERAIQPPAPPQASPIYDPTGLAFVVQEAVDKFMKPWLARLGLGLHDGVSREHWTKIKALNRRIAGELDVEYDKLQPVADLEARLKEAISRFLDNPVDWTRAPADEVEEQAAVSGVRRAVSIALPGLVLTRLIEGHLGEWRSAYDYSGTGSTSRRALAIRQIYETAAPLPTAAMTKPSADFMAEIRRIVRAAIEEAGGKVQLAEAA